MPQQGRDAQEDGMLRETDGKFHFFQLGQRIQAQGRVVVLHQLVQHRLAVFAGFLEEEIADIAALGPGLDELRTGPDALGGCNGALALGRGQQKGGHSHAAEGKDGV